MNRWIPIAAAIVGIFAAGCGAAGVTSGEPEVLVASSVSVLGHTVLPDAKPVVECKDPGWCYTKDIPAADPVVSPRIAKLSDAARAELLALVRTLADENCFNPRMKNCLGVHAGSGFRGPGNWYVSYALVTFEFENDDMTTFEWGYLPTGLAIAGMFDADGNFDAR